MNHPIKSSKGVSASGVRLFNRALAIGYQPSPTSVGPAKFIRLRKQAKTNRQPAI
jgi:hypothetical protein